MIFPYPDLIPRKFRYEFKPHEGKWKLSILHGEGAKTKAVDLLLTNSDLNLPRKKFNERFMRPALGALENPLRNI